MDQKVKVALVHCTRRRDGVAEALGLLRDGLKDAIKGAVVVKPNLVSHKRQLPSTHVDTLSVALDFALASHPSSVTIAEGASDATAGFERFGFKAVAHGRDVQFMDLNRDETEWESIELVGVDGDIRRARISRTLVSADCRISLALAKTHGNTLATFSLKNMLSSIHPADRIMMHGYAPEKSEWNGWKGALVRFLKGDSASVTMATRAIGRVKMLQATVEGKNREDGWLRLSEADRRFLKSHEALGTNLVRLSKAVTPHVSIVDGFLAMHGEGPRHGTPFPLGVIVAGTNAVAVDAVAASVMGFDPHEVNHLAKAEAAGLGPASLEEIEIVGDPLEKLRRRLRRHSHHAVLKHWQKVNPSANKPHFRPVHNFEHSRS